MFDHFSPNQLQDSSTHPCSTVQKNSKRTFKHFTKARGWIIAADSLRTSVQYFVCSMVEVRCRCQHSQILQQKYNISNEKSPLMFWMLLWCFHLDCVCMSRNWDHSVIAALLRSQHCQELTGIYWLHCPRMIRMRLDVLKLFQLCWCSSFEFCERIGGICSPFDLHILSRTRPTEAPPVGALIDPTLVKSHQILFMQHPTSILLASF